MFIRNKASKASGKKWGVWESSDHQAVLIPSEGESERRKAWWYDSKKEGRLH